MSNPRKALFSRKEIAFLIVPLLLVASLWLIPEPMYAMMFAAGKTGVCPLRQAVAVRRAADDMNRSTLSIAKRSMIVEKDAKRGLWRWNTPYGTFWAPPETQVPFLLSEQTTRVYGDGERRVRKDDVVFDCGANIGAFTREALNAGARLVVAIEPSARNVEALRLNFAQEIAQGRVIVYPKGLWHREEVLKFFVYDNSTLDSFVMAERSEEKSTKPREVQLPVTTLDRIVAELKLDGVDFIKMDIEGAERNAMEGAQSTLARFHPRMAVAMENLKDDQYEVPKRVRQAWAGYHQQCGRCTFTEGGDIRPDVMFFY